MTTVSGTAPLRVVFLVGSDSRSTRDSIEAVCQLAGVEPVAVLVDTGRDSAGRRLNNLRRNIRREGWGYLVHRLFGIVRAFTDGLVDRAIDPHEVMDVLRKAFPDRCFSLDDLRKKYGFAVRRAGNLNENQAAGLLKDCIADLAIVLGTRVLRPTTFEIPKLGSINLHKGRVPDYRGMPPGFWELYDGASSAGVTVHFVDRGLDTGDVIETSEVAIAPHENPDTLASKLDLEGAAALARAVAAIRDGIAHRVPQPTSSTKPRSKPSRRQVTELHRRLASWPAPQSSALVILKNLLALTVYYSGVYGLVRVCRRRSRAAIILYHRVNDFSSDALTVNSRTFAAHMLAISKRYPVISSAELTKRLHSGQPLSPTSVAIHFDDAYRDVHTHGGAILAALGIPATAFISSGFVDTARAFQHDVDKSPFSYANCTRVDLKEWIARGFEVGAHTVNHVNLGQVALDDARFEIVNSGLQLQQMIGCPVPLFSFPFGRIQDIRPEAREFVREAGYSALFSAYGGFITGNTSVWDIPRLGASPKHKPLYLLLEIERLDWAALARRISPERRP